MPSNAKANTPVSWRDVLPIHPAAELFPRMTDAEIAALGEDIKKNRLKHDIVLWSPGHSGDGAKKRPLYVLDGINRLDAMERVGIKFLNDKGETIDIYGARFRIEWEKQEVLSYSLTKGVTGKRVEPRTDPYAFVVSANIHRRHLTAEQKRELIGKLIKQQPNKSNRQIAATVKVSHPTVANVRDELEKKGDVEKVTTSIDSKGRKQPAKKERRTEGDFKRDVQAKKAAAVATAVPGDIGPMLPAEPPPNPVAVAKTAAVSVPGPVAASDLLAAIDHVMQLAAQEAAWPRGQTKECKKLLNEVRLRLLRLRELAQPRRGS